MLMTGTGECRANARSTRSSRSTDQSTNFGNARTAIRSTYEPSTRATSATCSSGSPSITTPSSNSIGQASLPGCSTTAWPPSCQVPSSKLVRVRIDGLKNSSATALPRSASPIGYRWYTSAALNSSSRSSRDQSWVLRKCFTGPPTERTR
jgi:hypothetical protein